MPMIVPFLPAIIGAGASIAGSAMASGSKTTTSTPTLSPALSGAQTDALTNLRGIINDPSAGLGPVKQAAQDSTNQAYKNMPNLISENLASRGFGSSGKVGDAVYDTEGSRLSTLGNQAGQFAQLGSQRQLSADQIINSMIATGEGHATTTPNNSLASGLMSGGSALTSLTTLATLAKMLGGAGGSGGGGNIGGVPGAGISIPDLLGSGAASFGSGFGGD